MREGLVGVYAPGGGAGSIVVVVVETVDRCWRSGRRNVGGS